MSVSYWRERLYKEPLSRDPVARFHLKLDKFLRPSHSVLDLGAGAGEENPYDLKPKLRKLIGVDLDPRVGKNPLLHGGLVADGGALPFADNSFDLAFSIYVLEHIARPAGLVAELQRVLKPGGLFLSLTPSRFHYVSLIASCTPTWFHKWVNERRGRRSADTFPTQYKLNSRGQVWKHFVKKGFALEDFDTFEVQPHYLTFSTPTFLLGAAYERTVNALGWLSPFRVNFICVLRNQKGGAVSP
jgi:SAM-dependent methyltransferase